MRLGDDLAAFRRLVLNRINDVHVGSAVAVQDSIRAGSPLTGAPGQPVGQYGPGYNEGSVGGMLLGSWQLQFLGPLDTLVSTNLVYAPVIEEMVGRYGPIRIRSSVGGGHSVALTRAGWQRITDAVTAQVVQ